MFPYQLPCLRPWIRMCANLLWSQRCPQCSVAGSGTNSAGFNNTEAGASESCASERQRVVQCVCVTKNLRKRLYVREWDPRKMNVSVYENAETIVSLLLPAFKVLYDMHTQPFLSHVGIQNAVCATYTVCTQTVIGIIFVHGNGNTHVRLTQWWNLFYFDGRHL